ncbi:MULTISPECIES: transcriptional regulator domain-containing protein [Bradyrhizobium]|uniref:transcriptional regulator domain-containing protein n=1 Tax=Bradyrhizobium TaxID=374 RepID=UPI0015576523|nr:MULTISPECIES: DUF6499 domain-containing protein [Bradyrhizobium]NPV20037.1 hypothetical protein [Bradyrhizobium aeschynomenes]
MSEFNWRSSESYKKLETADAADFAWECLRRNPDYRQDYSDLLAQDKDGPTDPAFRQRWGLSFRGRPDAPV